MRGAILRLDRLRENLRFLLTQRQGNEGILPVLKADGYGHGALIAAPILEKAARAFAVATPEEALALRRVTRKPILIFGYSPPEMTILLYKNGIMPTVFSIDSAHALAEEIQAGRKSGALPPDALLQVHWKIDTGMHRLGLLPVPSQLQPFLQRTLAEGVLRPVGIYSHAADPQSSEATLRQAKQLENATRCLHFDGLTTHFSASAAFLRYGCLGFSAFRPGLALWGFGHAALRPVMRLFARPVHTVRLGQGEGLGYRFAYRAPHAMTVATLPLGYADGLPRCASGAPILFCTPEGKCHPGRILGDICMDFFFAAATDGYSPTLRDVALLSPLVISRWAGTIPYEILCRVGGRVPRIPCFSEGEEHRMLFVGPKKT